MTPLTAGIIGFVAGMLAGGAILIWLIGLGMKWEEKRLYARYGKR